MGTWLYAGAVTGAFLLLGGAPAAAAPGEGNGLDPAGRVNLLTDVEPGQRPAGLTPDGRSAATAVTRESARFAGGVPLLGGLGGLRPANEVPCPDPVTGARATAMPAGGTAVDPISGDPIGPGHDQAADEQHGPEEPGDDEQRPFTGGGRPVAGEDQDFL